MNEDDDPIHLVGFEKRPTKEDYRSIVDELYSDEDIGLVESMKYLSTKIVKSNHKKVKFLN